MKWEETFFVVKWMFENINTTQLDSSEDYRISQIADDAHTAFLKEQIVKSKLAQAPKTATSVMVSDSEK